MSRIGKQQIKIPEGTSVSVNGVIKAKGPKGELEMKKPEGFSFDIKDGFIKVIPDEKTQKSKNGPALWGLYRSLLLGMITGVSVGFEKILEFEGVGYKATVKGSDLEFQLGFSHPVFVKAPEGIVFKVEKNKIIISGSDKYVVGQIAAKIRSEKPPEPYKGKGIRYEKEIILRKAGKKAVASGS